MKNFVRLFALAVIAAGLLASAAAKADVYFRDNDRVVLREYVTAPSEHVTFYTAGSILPETVTYSELPSTVVEKLSPAPSGATYVSYGGNVYLIDKKKRTIIDAVQLY
jgi:hypothetical protein